ncbi:MAG: hypothetical protein IT239_03330 [Bacteroidia bacterium]|nr:hypothetical protein [Bacteroidia bacterium]
MENQPNNKRTVSAVELNTTNTEAITYTTSEIQYTILGGIKLDGLDRLRVTLKIEVVNRKFTHYLNNPDIADLALRQNLDLYNDTQVEKLIRKIAERCEVGSSAVAKNIADITNQLESYRLAEIDKQKLDTVTTKKILSEEETQQALELLKTKNLTLKTNELIGKSGVVGEELNRLLMYIIFTSRKLRNPLHILSLGSSGTGKSHLQEKVAELMPAEDVISNTSLTASAFYYYDTHQLTNKLLLFEDIDGLSEESLYAWRELMSKHSISRSMPYKDTKGNTKTKQLVVKGPVSTAGCTTKERIYEDNANRSFLIYLDESKEQDEKVMSYQRLKAAGKIDSTEQEQIKKLMQNCQRILKPITIKNPFAEYLQLPKEVFKPRRTNKHYIDFIEAITFYHQYQRTEEVDESTGELYINTTIQDIEEANKLMKEILLRKSDELSGACRNYFEALKIHLKENNQTTFTNRSAGSSLQIAHTTVKRYNYDLQNAGLIKVNTDKKVKTFTYQITTTEEYEKLKAKINNALDEVLQKLITITTADKKQPIGLNQPTKQNEPTKTNDNSTYKEQPSINEEKAIRLKKNTCPELVEGSTQKTQLGESTKTAYSILLNHSKENPNTQYTTKLVMQLTNKSQKMVQIYLSELTQHQALEKTLQGGRPFYTIVTSHSLSTNP